MMEAPLAPDQINQPLWRKPMKPSPLPAVVYRLAVAGWVGGASLFTLVLTPTIFKSFDRDMAGQIVGALFPGYFRWGLVCGGVALAAIFMSSTLERKKIAVPLIVVMLALSSIQAFVIEPRAAAIKKQIPSFATAAKDDPLRRQFGKWHGVSAGLNLAVIGGGIALIILL